MRLVRRAARPEAERRSWQSWALPVLGVLSLAVIWELGSLVIRLTSDHPNTIWPSLEYVWTDALPGIGAVGQANSALGTYSMDSDPATGRIAAGGVFTKFNFSRINQPYFAQFG